MTLYDIFKTKTGRKCYKMEGFPDDDADIIASFRNPGDAWDYLVLNKDDRFVVYWAEDSEGEVIFIVK